MAIRLDPADARFLVEILQVTDTPIHSGLAAELDALRDTASTEEAPSVSVSPELAEAGQEALRVIRHQPGYDIPNARTRRRHLSQALLPLV